jgi:hypothetical protein
MSEKWFLELVEEKALDMLQPGSPVISIKELQAAVEEAILQLANEEDKDSVDDNDSQPLKEKINEDYVKSLLNSLIVPL